MFTGEGRGGDAGDRHPRALSPKLLFLVLLFVGGTLLAYVTQVRMRVGFGGQRLLAAAAGRQQLALLGIPTLHPEVLEPDFNLSSGRRGSVSNGPGAPSMRLYAQITHGARRISHLRIFQAEFGRQFLPVGFADVFLFLEHFLQSFTLHVGEHRPPQHASAGLSPGGQWPREGPGDGDNGGGRCKANRRAPAVDLEGIAGSHGRTDVRKLRVVHCFP